MSHYSRGLLNRASLLLALLLAIALPLSAPPAHADLAGPTDGGRAIILESESKFIADGIQHSRYVRLDEEGRNTINVMKVDLSRTDVKYLDSGVVAGVETVSNMAEAGDVDAAVNGDFFDINNSGAALGGAVSDGEVVKSPTIHHEDVAVVSEEGLGSIMSLMLEGEIVVNGQAPRPINGINMTKLTGGKVSVYDHRWGTHTLTQPLNGDQTHLAVRISNGKVTAVGEELGASINIPEGDQILLARGKSGIARISDLAVGDTVSVSVGLTDDVDKIAVAIGGRSPDLVDETGALTPEDDSSAMARTMHPRTAIGFGDNGATMYLVTVDGRSTQSRGMDLYELGRLMVELGATEAMNLDGGGSTTMVSRDPDEKDMEVNNTPSDGSERTNGNALGVRSRASDGVLSGIAVRAEGVSQNAGRLFPGMTRSLTARPHDRGGRAVEAHITWRSSNESVATVTPDGTVTGVAPGRADIIATSGGVVSKWAVHVLGPVQFITVTASVLQISGPGQEHTATVIGVDPRGYRAPINPGDITVEDAGALNLEPGTDSTFVITSNETDAGGTVTLTAGGRSTHISYLVGTKDVVVTDMSEPIDQFTIAGARADQSIEKRPGEGRNGSDAVAISVDFSQSTSTRTANLRPVADSHPSRFIDGTSVALRAWVKGDGVHTPMLYAIVDNEAGDVPVVYSPAIKATTEWQEVIIPTPQGFSGPFRWENFALYETSGTKQYKTTVLVDSIEMVVAPNVEAPEFVQRRDHLAIADAGEADEHPTRIAVMSDAQFVGRNPDSQYVEGARRSLREMVSAKPDAIYILGDFVDEANDEDFELARRVIEEEIEPSGIPWTYVPGNHEIQGQPIENFISHFGETSTVKNYGSTRVITLDSSPYDLAFSQIRQLRTELNRAADDPGVSGVVVMFHHPTRDFMPSGNSGLKDPAEAEMVEQWLARFNEETGKQISLVGAGVGAFHARHQDNVLHITNGNSGKAAESSVDWGGFRGWTMLGIEPSGGPRVTDWMHVETHAWVDEGSLSIQAPAEAEAGQSITVDAGFTQEGIEIPVRWPVSHAWAGDGFFVGDPEDAPAEAMAVLDPITRELTFADNASGEMTLNLTVNGATTSHTFTLPKADDEPEPETAVSTNTAGSALVGQGANVWGTVTGGKEGGRATVQVLINGSWYNSRQTILKDGGGYVLPLTYGMDHAGTHAYRVVAEGHAGGWIVSDPFSFTRATSVTETHVPSKAVGETTFVWGTAHGAAEGDPVVVQVLIDGNWVNSQRGQIKSGGGYLLPLTYGKDTRGETNYRVVVASSNNGYIVSDPFTVIRTR